MSRRPKKNSNNSKKIRKIEYKRIDGDANPRPPPRSKYWCLRPLGHRRPTLLILIFRFLTHCKSQLTEMQFSRKLKKLQQNDRESFSICAVANKYFFLGCCLVIVVVVVLCSCVPGQTLLIWETITYKSVIITDWKLEEIVWWTGLTVWLIKLNFHGWMNPLTHM